ncbi:MAG: methionine aminotransferase [Bacteroidota bacterium]|nr:methionine aminotransferase [Candidatus Kapabacteria bacterium]MDW8220328.1 methionine aminotransferase [Bacteroidota bacterium]
MECPSKLPHIGTTIFTVMSQMAHAYKAINLAQGFPNFPPHPQLLEAASAAMNRGLNQYAPMAGYMPLRERIAEKIDSTYGRSINPDTEITVTPGATAALFAAMMSVVHHGDEVIVIEPCYDSYIPTLTLCHAVIRRVSMRFPNYTIDWDAVEGNVSPRTRMITLNSPHNPSGSILCSEDIQRLIAIVQDTDIIILSDEVYEHITFEGIRHESMLRYPQLAERSFVVSSFGKTFHVTGWKTGYCVAPRELMQEFRKVYQFMNFSCFTPAQAAFAEMLSNPSHYKDLSAFYQAKRDYFCHLMAGSRFELLPSYGSYFQLARYDAITHERDTDFAIRLTQNYGVAAIPVSAFYTDGTDNHVLRFCFAKTDETLEQAAAILTRL